MKSRNALFFLLFLSVIVFAFRKADNPGEWVNLLDSDLHQWQTYLSYHHKATYDGSVPVDNQGKFIEPVGLNKDSSKVFSVVTMDGEPVLKVTGEYYGCVFTNKSYKNFRLKLKVKFGTKKWEARTNKLMDAGLLYFSQGPCGVDFWRTWMLSQEFQIMEGHFGDYWNISSSAIDIRAYLSEGSMCSVAGNTQAFLPFGSGTNRTGFCLRTADYSTPGNGWTQIELICYEGKSLHIVNGHVVMVLANSRYNDNGVASPLIEGKIQLQSEACEVYYKDIKIQTIDTKPAEFKGLND